MDTIYWTLGFDDRSIIVALLNLKYHDGCNIFSTFITLDVYWTGWIANQVILFKTGQIL